VVAAASYEARAFGVHSATPMVRARRVCPDGVFLAPRFDRYRAVSDAVMAVLRSFTPVVEPIALDEAFLDVAGARRLHGDAPAIAGAIRARVRADVGLTASVGVATTKLVAKLASDLCKPDGLMVVEPGTELGFLHPLEVRRLWGVGPATARRLAPLGVRTVGDLAVQSEAALVAALGSAAGSRLHALAWNRDERAVESAHDVKSIGQERTFPTDLVDRRALDRELGQLADGVASRMRAAGRVGRGVQLKVRFADFRTITRSRTLARPTDLAADLARVARELLAGVDVGPGIRLLGVAAHHLEAHDPEGPEPGSLFATGTGETTGAEALPGIDAERQAAVERSLDAVRARFGAGAIGPGAANSLPQEGSGHPTR
jgi:DNA polymerase-4